MNLFQAVRESLSTALRHDTLAVQLVDSGKAQVTTVLDWIRWLGDLLPRIAWPMIGSLLVLYLVFSPNAPRRLARLFKPFRSFKLLGAEFVLSEEAAKELAVDAEEAFATYRKRAKREYDLLVDAYDIRSKLENVLEHIWGGKKGIGKTKDFRSTIHVRDILFDEGLYQLLDYYPRGGGGGRTKSIRFGIIGKVWRSGSSLVQDEVSTDPADLILDWGMTREEAEAAGLGRKSFVCVLLRDSTKTPVGLFYIDAAGGAFGSEKQKQELIGAIDANCRDQGLTEALASIGHQLRGRAPVIPIYD
jgi:hypothetical protein